jgi:hypothetical protein
MFGVNSLVRVDDALSFRKTDGRWQERKSGRVANDRVFALRPHSIPYGQWIKMPGLDSEFFQNPPKYDRTRHGERTRFRILSRTRQNTTEPATARERGSEFSPEPAKTRQNPPRRERVPNSLQNPPKHDRIRHRTGWRFQSWERIADCSFPPGIGLRSAGNRHRSPEFEVPSPAAVPMTVSCYPESGNSSLN